MRKDDMKRLISELAELSTTRPCEGIKVDFNEENITEVLAEIEGPAGTPYEGGSFRVKLLLGGDFPSVPPKGYFLTKAFHPNISEKGEICVSVLKKDWKPEMGVRHVLLAVRCLLIQPFAESALNEEAGRLLLEDYDLFHKQAKLMTSVHATPAKRPMPLSARHGAGLNTPLDCDNSKPLSEPGCGSPVMKKAKPGGTTAVAKKRALKRL